ncbi:ankyrin repeat-containing protein BDA1-like [Cornus florida]|uniref:ankyrin repeat-containing protein BDA1-like n=1 Tax=Cornus florida TaxID=4283 RepID=UPI0028985DAF|nr:ankyrin repeat-containing protein BDA1-like [Cornus florida]XP_059642037.1 ankyrin repeat-containing protein BDA1-like [Cornus florida]
MDKQRLMKEAAQAAQAGDVNVLYALFRINPYVLKSIDEIRFVDTPLHIAASNGHIHFAVEMISLMPSFGKKLNPDGLSPLHLALQNRRTETVMRLININSEIIRVQGKGGITPLHYVAERNEVGLLAEFLCACPDSMQDLTIRGETAVHIAVRNRNCKAFEVLFNWIDKTNNLPLLQWKDEDGNTVLHIATYTNQPQVVKKLVKAVELKGDKNMQGLAAFDLISSDESNSEIKNMLAASRSFTRFWKPNSASDNYLADFIRNRRVPNIVNMRKMSIDSKLRETVLLIAALVATATYQVAVAPPEGIFQLDENGKSMTALAVPEIFYYCLLFINSTSFAISVGVIFLSLQIGIHYQLLRLCLYFIMVSYIISVLFTAPKNVFSYMAVSAPFLLYLWSAFVYLKEIFVFTRMPIGRYNASRYFDMRKKMVGWDAIH